MGIFGPKRKTAYDSLTQEEKNAVDYHRRNLEAGFVQQNGDGSGTSFKGAVEDINGKPTYFPTFWNGRELPLDQARQRVLNSGIQFPTYPTYDAALAREKMIHDQIMAPDMRAYLQRLKRK
jgi:hypothetical protein